VTGSIEIYDDDSARSPSLTALWDYLRDAGWDLADQDGRTSMWRPSSPDLQEYRVVLPTRQKVRDYEARVYEALRTLAYVERRSLDEVASDVNFGAADTVATRLASDAPPGEAPLSLAYLALSALRSYVIGSGSALDSPSLVLPPRRPRRAESYVDRVRFATRPGSFIMTLALPLMEVYEDTTSVESASQENPNEEPDAGVQEALLQIPPQPYGRRVTNRMATSARYAQQLAEEVSTGNQPMRVFGLPNPSAANATELEALSNLGGPYKIPYLLRFAQSPRLSHRQDAVTLQITPGQQRIMSEAADYLRTKQPRTDVAVEGIVVRLSRDRHYGPGVVVVQGIADDSGTERRFYVELTEDDYNEALRAHREGLRVLARGDVDTRGTYTWLRPLRAFAVVPGLEYG
jgi:hypothetical protein